MLNHNHDTQAQIHKTISAVKDEQRAYVARIEKMQQIGTLDCLSSELSWATMSACMSGEIYPASKRQYLTHLGWSKDEIPSLRRVATIGDGIVRGATELLHGSHEQLLRLKSKAVFFEALQASPDDPFAIRLFQIWLSHSATKQLEFEAGRAGDTAKAADMERLSNILTSLFDWVVKKQAGGV